MFNCQVEVFLIKYLGIPVSDNCLRVKELMFVGHKVQKRMGIWQCMYLSSGGKTVLIESCLSLDVSFSRCCSQKDGFLEIKFLLA